MGKRGTVSTTAPGWTGSSKKMKTEAAEGKDALEAAQAPETTVACFSHKDAQNKMKEWGPEVDAQNPRHVDAFLAIAAGRGKGGRVRKEAVLKIIQESQSDFVERAQTSSISYLTVPRMNFPRREAPKVLVPFLRSIDFLREACEVVEDGTDWHDIFIFDASIKANPPLWAQLGAGVVKKKFVLSLGCRTKDARSSPAAAPEVPAAAPARTFSAVAPAVPAEAPALGAPAAPAPGSPAAAPAAVQPSAPVKKRRSLAERFSDDSGTVEERTLSSLVQACDEAAAAGRITSGDPTNNKTVEFWARQVAEGLAVTPVGGASASTGGGACTGGAARAEAALVRDDFPALLTHILRKNRCHSSLPKFLPIFEKLQKHGCKLGAGYAVIKALANHPLTSVTAVALEDVDIHTRRRFARDPLWDDFLAQRLLALLGVAKTASGAERETALVAARSLAADIPVGGISEELRAEVGMAASLFSTAVPLADRVAYCTESPERVAYAETWSADFPFGALSFVFTGRRRRRPILAFLGRICPGPPSSSFPVTARTPALASRRPSSWPSSTSWRRRGHGAGSLGGRRSCTRSWRPGWVARRVGRPPRWIGRR